MPDARNTKQVAVIGFGITGKACVEFLLRHKYQVTLFASNLAAIQLNPSNQLTLSKTTLKDFDEDSCFDPFEFVVVSPGIDTKHPALLTAAQNNISLISDIELFAQTNRADVISVTGSNGKSTVVDMLYKAFKACGVKVGLGGNIGTSAVSLLDKHHDLVILEISSFQLELTHNLQSKIACVLNVTEDHIDRHGDLTEYALTKRKIYNNADIIIYNRDDAETQVENAPSPKTAVLSFGFNACADKHAISQDSRGIWLNGKLLIKSQALQHISRHNCKNIQVALLIAQQYFNASPSSVFINALISYKGLPHRFEKFAEQQNQKGQAITYINDSKATNPAATLAALASLPKDIFLVLIVGGDSKNSDLSLLADKIKNSVDMLFCLGKDKQLFLSMHNNSIACESFDAILDRVNERVNEVNKPVYVLLSPACASIDMFDNYQQRGDLFKHAVSSRCTV